MSGQQGESPSGTIIREYTDLPIIDQRMNRWSLTQARQVMVDGEVDRGTAAVTELMYINRVFWQWVKDKRLWWYKTGPLAPWLPVGGTTDAPIGPIPDPRLDTIISAIGSLATADAAAFGGMAARIDAVQLAIDSLPPPPPPDPRIATLIGFTTRGFAMVHSNMASLRDATDEIRAHLNAVELAANARFDAIAAAQVIAAVKQDELAAQVERIVVMLLDLFSKPPPRIVVGLPTFTTQPAPTSPGP